MSIAKIQSMRFDFRPDPAIYSLRIIVNTMYLKKSET